MNFTKLLCACLGALIVATVPSRAEPIRPKVVVVATFEIGADTGDKPGEFQFWVERAKLTNSISVPGVDRPLRYNDAGVYGFVSGTTVRSAVQVMALLADPRFDFSKSYWLVNGIAGVDPENASVGSAAWARWIIDGDIAYEIDSREAPAEWHYGVVPIGGKKPNEIPKDAEWAPKPMAWKLNPSLVNWAYGLTKDIVIPETETAKKHRATFAGFEKGSGAPKVILGESMGSCRYWHGSVMTKWANDWTKLYTRGEGDFVMTNMEDHGICTALERMGKLGKVDFQRLLLLRTGSNYCTPRPGQKSSESMTEEYSGMEPALESAWLAGSKVMNALVDGWAKFEKEIPR
jgi:purine nucleoside permease